MYRRERVEKEKCRIVCFSLYLYVDVSTNAVAHRVDEYKYDIALKNNEKKELHNIGSGCRRVRQARQCKSVSNARRCGPMPTNMRGKKQATELKTVWAVAPLRSAPPAGEPPADKEHKYRHMPMRRCAGRWPALCNAELTHRLKWYGYQL